MNVAIAIRMLKHIRKEMVAAQQWDSSFYICYSLDRFVTYKERKFNLGELSGKSYNNYDITKDNLQSWIQKQLDPTGGTVSLDRAITESGLNTDIMYGSKTARLIIRIKFIDLMLVALECGCVRGNYPIAMLLSWFKTEIAKSGEAFKMEIV